VDNLLESGTKLISKSETKSALNILLIGRTVKKTFRYRINGEVSLLAQTPNLDAIIRFRTLNSLAFFETKRKQKILICFVWFSNLVSQSEPRTKTEII
jgi:hypothetical protein